MQGDSNMEQNGSVEQLPKKRVPFLLRWWVIALILCTGIGSWIAIFLALWRILYNRKHPECKNHGIIKKLFVGVAVIFLLLVLVALFMPQDNTPHSTDPIPTTQQPVQNTENEPEESITSPSDVGSDAEENTTTPSDSNPVESIPDKQEVIEEISGFGKIEYLKKIDTYDVLSICNNYLLLRERDGDSTHNVVYDIKRNKELLSAGSFPDIDGFEKGYLLSIVTADADSNTEYITRLTNIDGDLIVQSSDDFHIEEVFYTKKQYLATRDVETYAYSGKEYALLDFEGNVIREWAQDSESKKWEYMGYGMYYLPDSKMLYDALNDSRFAWPYMEYEVDENYIQNGPGYIHMGILKEEYGEYEYYPRVEITTFDLDGCLIYYEGSYSDDPAAFYSMDRMGNYTLINEAYNVCDVMYLESDRSFYYCTRDDSLSYDYYKDLKIYDMYGNLAFDLSQYPVVRYTIGADHVGVKLQNLEGNHTRYFYTVIDRNGNMMFDPILCTDAEVTLLPEERIFYFVDYEKLTVFDFAGHIIGEINPITVEEKQLIFTKERKYIPIELRIFGDYYSVKCIELDDYKERMFMGDVKR